MTRTTRAVAIVVLVVLASLAVGFGTPVASADEPEKGQQIASFGPGDHQLDVSGRAAVVVELRGARGSDGQFSECDGTGGLGAFGGPGGDGAVVQAVVDVSGVSTLNLSAASQGSTSGWTDGQAGEEVSSNINNNDPGDGGNGAGSSGVGWNGQTVLEAGGGGGGQGGSSSHSNGGDGGNGGGPGGAGGSYFQGQCDDGNPGEDGDGSADSTLTTNYYESGSNSGDGSVTVYVAPTQAAPELSDPQPADGTQLPNYQTELAVDVQDDDFDRPGDSVNVTFWDVEDGTRIGSETLTSPGTANVSWSGLAPGVGRWNATATDGGNRTVSVGPFRVLAPDDLYVREEPSGDLIDDRTVNASFYPTLERDEDVIQRSTDSGVLDLTGLPTSQDVLVDVEAPSHVSRSILLRNLSRQQTAYLLNDSVETVQPTFRITDRTNNFPPDRSRLLVRRPISTGANSSSYRTIWGDIFGADQEASPQLEPGVRYRVVVESPSGAQRSFGTYRPTSSKVIDLNVGEIDIGAPGDAGYAFNAWTMDDGSKIRISYRDREALTSELELTVHEANDEGNVLFGPETVQEPERYQETITVPADQQNVSRWVVDYTIRRDGEAITGEHAVGGVGRLDVPVSWTLLQTVSLYGLLLLAGLFGGAAGRAGAVVLVVVAFPLTFLGLLTVPYPALILAGIVALLFKAGEPDSPGVVPS